MYSKSGTAKKIAVLSLLTGLSLIMFIVENLLPPLFIPGAKLGLANIFSFAALILYSPVEAFLVLTARTVLGAVFAGNLSALLYSFTGGAVSMAVSSVLIYTLYPKISVMAVSVAAAVLHNITQNIIFVLLTGSALLFGYMPYLALIGIFSGGVVGGITLVIFKGIPTKLLMEV
ncbi:MAG: Gx transporter family protein [Clostridiales bacterium]|nr:Gx transporter family protein [Clostridiales bacterium]